MAQELRAGTTVTVQMGPAVDATDGATPETAHSPSIFIAKAGAAFAARSSATAPAHDRDGWYRVELNTTDTGTAGMLDAEYTAAATHLPVFKHFMVLHADAWDFKYSTGLAKADLRQVEGTASIDGQGPLAFLRLVGAILLGKVSGAAANNPIFRAANDSKNRVTVTGDASGNRSSVTLDGT